ncbi:MAG: hypothetical protein WCP73_08625 [Eubacteriales bacterium]
MDLEKILTEYNQLPNEQKKEIVRELQEYGPEKLMPYCSGSVPLKNPRKLGETDFVARSALRVLADMGKNAAGLVRQNDAFFIAQLKSEDPKIRILAAEILGSAAGTMPSVNGGKPVRSDYTKELVTACHAEQTMFTLPSYLLAIGAQKTEAAKRYLECYTIRSEADKHIREEKLALQKALANFIERRPAQIRILENDVLALTCPNSAITLAEAKQKGLLCRIGKQ